MTGCQEEARSGPSRFPGVAVAFLVIAATAVGCGDYAVRLPGGYELTRVYAGAVLIARPDHEGLAVNANIDRYAVVGHLVVGHVSLAKHEFERSLSKPGYFVLDTNNGDVKVGMDLESWRLELREMGVSPEPPLAEPSRFDRNYE